MAPLFNIWTDHLQDGSGNYYYFNRKTNQTQRENIDPTCNAPITTDPGPAGILEPAHA